MADFTQKEIRKTFISLLETKRADKITVREISSECGINRNTFYYHYRDIPHLIETIIEEDAEYIIAETKEEKTLSECLKKAIDFALDHKSAVMNIYCAERYIFDISLWKVADHVVRSYLKTVYSADRMNEKMESVIVYLRCVLFGLVSAWLDSSMDERVLKELNIISSFKKGDLESLVRKAGL